MKKESEAIREIQSRIGYQFKNTDLLTQAFVRRSYAKENGGEDNEVLEFIGDRVLDLIVVKLLTEKYGRIRNAQVAESDNSNVLVCKKNEGQLSDMKRQLVEKQFLACRMNDLGLSKYLFMSKGDREQDIQYSPSALEDLLEAIIGAVALDSNWDLNILQNVIDNLIVFDRYDNDEDLNYTELLQNWSMKKNKVLPDVSFVPLQSGESPQNVILPRNVICNAMEEKRRTTNGMPYVEISEVKKCVIILKGIDYIFWGYGYSNKTARKAASKTAYEYLEDNNLLISIRDEIDENHINEFEAINQLETLSRRGYFSLPWYEFYQFSDMQGNPVWECTCIIQDYLKGFSAESSSKKEAKKLAALEMLKFVLQKPPKKTILIGGNENED